MKTSLVLRRMGAILIVASLCLGATQIGIGATWHLSIASGEFERSGTPVSVELPDDFSEATAHFQLSGADGQTIPSQFEAPNRISFVLLDLPRRSLANFKLAAVTPPENAPDSLIAVRKTGKKLIATVHGQPALEYQAEPGELPRPDIKPIYRRGGYIHPVYSPSGRPVTADFPPDHIHHHGVWFPWTKTEFEGRTPDFWNMGSGSGTVEFVALDRFWSGPVHGGFHARHRFLDLSASEPKVALNEDWAVRVYGITATPRPYGMFDLVSTQTGASASPLVLPTYHYGGLGLRGSSDWYGADKAFFLTSEGETDRVKGNETRARWCYMGGMSGGQQAGFAVLCHPENFRAPQPLRLHPREPYFCYAPSQLGEWRIEPGQPYVSRYRFVVMDGPPDQEELDKLWSDYAHPPQVTVRREDN